MTGNRGYWDGGPERLREAIARLGEAAELLPRDESARFTCLMTKSQFLRLVYDHTDETAALDDAIAAYCEVADSPHALPDDRAKATAWGAHLLMMRYYRNGGRADLEATAHGFDAALASPDLPHDVSAWAVLPRLEAHDRRARLHSAPPYKRTAAVPPGCIVVSAHDDPTKLEPYDPKDVQKHIDGGAGRAPAALAAFARVELQQCAGRPGADGALPAVNAARAAVLATPPGDPGLPPLLVMLGDAMRLHSTLTEDRALLLGTVFVYRWAGQVLPRDAPRLTETLTKAANVLHAYTKAYALPVDGAHAREELAFRRMAAAVAASRNDRLTHRIYNTLAAAVMERDLPRDGVPFWEAPLERRIAALRAAIARPPAGAAEPFTGAAAISAEAGERAWLRFLLADSLHDRFEEAGDLGDLDESIALLREAADLTAGSLQAWVLRDLATGLRMRYSITSRPDDRRHAVQAAHQAKAADPDIALTAEDLRGEYRYQARAYSSEPDIIPPHYLDRLRNATPGDREAIADLCDLSSIHWDRMIKAGHETRADLDLAVRIARRLSELIISPADAVERSAQVFGLAVTLRRRFDRFGDPADRAEAQATAERIVTDPGSPEIRVHAAQAAGMWAAIDGRWEAAAQAFRQAIELLPVLSPRQTSRRDQERRLATMFGLASQAAAAALQHGDAAGALEGLERGRGLLRDYATEGRSDFPELADRAPELARELRSVADEMDAAAHPPHGAPEISADERHQLARRWDDAVRRARALPGLEGFLRPPATADLLAGPGTIVVVNVSTYRCDALVIDSGRLSVVPLPGLTSDKLNEQVVIFLDTIPFTNLGAGNSEDQRLAQQPLREVLGWLWDVVAEPVLDHLGLTGRRPGDRRDVENPPRIWWVPTGMLTYLPIHAAGRPGELAVLDRAVSSYAVAVRTLRAAQVTATEQSWSTAEDRLLAVAMPQRPGEAPLPHSASEITELMERFIRFVVLSGDEATYDRVLAELPRASWAHFACHAVSDPLRPSRSRLSLWDRPLDVGTIAGQRLSRRPRLAYLSACESARGGRELADEGISLASAFHLAGFEHAVATLWPILDSVAADTAAAFYRKLAAHGGTSPAVALRHAQLDLRARYPDLPTHWAAYVHMGP